MIYPIQSNSVKGIDAVIARYQKSLDSSLTDWNIYPRLEEKDEKFRYFEGEGKDYREVLFAESKKTIGFSVSEEEDLGNQSKCLLKVHVRIKELDVAKRNISDIKNQIREILRCTYQLTKCEISNIEDSKEKNNLQPFISFDIEIKANYVSYYELKNN